MTWSLDVEVVDKGSKKELAALSRAQEQAARDAVDAARKVEQAAAREAKAVRDAADEKRAAATKAAAAASRAADAEVKAARAAQRANSDAARKRLADAKAVAAAAAKASRAANQEASAAEKSARDRERAAGRASKAVKQAQREHQQATDKIQKAERDVADEAEQQARRTAKAWGGIKDRIGNAFEGLGGKGKAGLAAAGTAGGAAFLTGMTAYMGREGTAKRLAAQLGVPEREARQIGAAVGRLYVQGFGESREDVAAVAVDVARNVGDVTRRELERATGTTIRIADLFDADSSELSRTVGSMLKNDLAGSVDEAMDAITVGFQRGANVGDELLDTLNEYAEPMHSLGIDASTFTSMLVAGAEQGVWSIDKLGDAYKEFSIRATDGSTATVDAYHSLGLSAREFEQAIASGGDSAKRATSAVIDALRGVSDPVKREAAGVALFGTMWEDVGGDIIMSLDPAKAQIEGTADAARELGGAFDTPGQRLEAFKRKVADSLVNFIGTEAVPVLEDLGEVAEEHWPEIREQIEPVAKAVKDATREVAEFVGEHPQLLKVAAGAMAVTAAVKTIKFVGAITGLSALLRGMRRLLPLGRRSGAELGTELGTELASNAGTNARRGLRKDGALTGGLRGRMRSVGSALGGWLGVPMGKTAAEKASSGIAANGAITGPANKGGRLASIGRALGRTIGVAAVAGLAYELNQLASEEAGLGLQDLWKKFSGGMSLDFLKPWGGATGGRLTTTGFKPFVAGGIATAALALGVPAFASGGVVPAMVSSGEVLRFPSGQWAQVPGPRVAADNVFMPLPIDTEVYTDHGQSLLAAGFTRRDALTEQLPHFAKGGSVKRQGGFTATAYGPPWGGIQGTGTTATGINLKDGPKRYIVAVDPAVIPLKTKFGIWPNPFGYRGAFSAEDTGGAIKGKRLDFYDWRGRESQNAWGRRSGITVGTTATESATEEHAGDSGRPTTYTVRRKYGRSTTRGGLLDDPYSVGYSAVEAWGSRAAARRAGATLGVTDIREALDQAKESHTRTLERAGSRSRAKRGSGDLVSPPSSGAGGWQRPVSGPITSRYGMRNGRMHKGIDFGVGVGTAVRAVRAGTVIAGMADPNGWGINTRVLHENGLSSLYAHLSKITLAANTKVNAGDVIARSGNTGRSTGPHLHLETWRGGQAFNPADVLPLRRGGLVRPVKARRGGLIAPGFLRRFNTGGTAKKTVKKPPPRTNAIASTLGDVRQSSSSAHLEAFSKAIESAALERVERLRVALLKEVRGPGDMRALDRVRAALSQVEVDLAGRTQEYLVRLGRKQAGWESKLTSDDHLRRRAAISDDSAYGIAWRQNDARTFVRDEAPSQLASANAAISGARRNVRDATTAEGREAARAKLTEAKDSKREILDARTEAKTVLQELARQLPRALAGERLQKVDLADAWANFGGRNPETDAGALAARQKELNSQLAEAVKRGDAEWQIEVLQSLTGVRDSIHALPRSLASERVAGLGLRDAEESMRGGDPSMNFDALVMNQQEWVGQFIAAQQSGNVEWQTEAANQLTGIHQSMRDLPAKMSAREDAGYDLQGALAALTEGDEDDRAILAEREARVQQRLDEAQAKLAASTNDADREAYTAQATAQATLLKQIRDEIKAGNTAQQERDARDEEIKTLLTTIATNTQRAARGSEMTAATTAKWQTDGATGQVARNIGMRGATPGYAGGGVRG